jgi:hypothetical protein
MKDSFPRRIRFVKSTAEQRGQVRRVSVELLRPNEGTYVGSAERSAADEDLLRAGAEAATEAVMSAAPADGTRVAVEAIERVHLFEREMVVVSVSAQYKGREYSLFGVCEIRDDPATAGALAVLSATNRVMELS